MKKKIFNSSEISRRDFVKQCVMGTVVLSSGSLISCIGLQKSSSMRWSASQVIPLDQNWLFGGEFKEGALGLEFNDSYYSEINIPHCVANLSWQDWKPEEWQKIWSYRRYFTLPKRLRGTRIFLHFEGVMVGAKPAVNGHLLPSHLGGYLPFSYEITDQVHEGENLLAVAVDSRWSNVPPQGSSHGPKSIDYLEAGGIHRSVRLEAVPQIYINDVFAKPVNVLKDDRRIDLSCSIDAAILPNEPIQLLVEMKDGAKVITSLRQTLNVEKTGQSKVSLSLARLGEVTLWDVDHPYLYDIVVTLLIDGHPLHNYQTRVGLREARFEIEGFFLNGRRLQLFGLNRHEIYPYVGYAMPTRVMRRDAEILKQELNCNMVRCSHYPQNEAFLDACDELGLLVWEEVPGWQYIGDASWKELLIRDVKDMIIRDRNRPSVVIWGTRVNESANDVELYKKTRELAKMLDDSRPTSGSMTDWSRKTWKEKWDEDVFAHDDYHARPDGTVGIHEPVDGFPYMLAEAVGQFNYTNKRNFDSYYRRLSDVKDQQLQALRHAQAHSRAGENRHNSGVIAWCAFEYASLLNDHRTVKYPGVMDFFRIPKLGATFYLAQCDPQIKPVIHPNFYWDFGPKSPRGPGKNVAIFSNCELLKIFINDQPYAELLPDTRNYPNLKHAPFFVDLDINGSDHPELRIEGYVNGKMVVSRLFSSNPLHDQLLLVADDAELIANGSDATRVIFRIVDQFGGIRPFAKGNVNFKIEGPGVIIGDNPFNLEESGGSGAIWIKSLNHIKGEIRVIASHPLGTKSSLITSKII
ncbi:MAG: glycoside hydrolase family 2 protein [Porphyromonadaceae bacterium]|nr:glycoside hydrolase family 2 protein [Porphyromonadaceae bacterium]